MDTVKIIHKDLTLYLCDRHINILDNINDPVICLLAGDLGISIDLYDSLIMKLIKYNCIEIAFYVDNEEYLHSYIDNIVEGSGKIDVVTSGYGIADYDFEFVVEMVLKYTYMDGGRFVCVAVLNENEPNFDARVEIIKKVMNAILE